MRSHKQPEDMSQARAAAPRGGRGFSLVELVIVLAVVSTVMTFAVLGIKKSMAAIRLQNSMRQLASRVELARTDAIRRHQTSTVEFTDTQKYVITMDFNGNGVESTRSYTLESGVSLINPATDLAPTDLPVFSFDWRGRTPQCFTSLSMKSAEGGGSSALSVSSAGDVTVDAGLSANMNAGTFTTVSQTTDVQTGAVVSGVSPVCNDPCGGCAAAACATCSVPSTPPPGCVAFSLKPGFISIRKNNKSSLDITVTVTTADTVTVIQNDGRTNLDFTPSATQTIAPGSPKAFTVKSKNNLTGTFPLKFISACNPSNAAYATVQVGN